MARARPRRRNATVALGVALAAMAAAQFATAWAIHTDRLPVRDPLYTDRFAALGAHPGFAPGAKPQRLLFIGSSRTLNSVNAGAAEAALASKLGRPVASFNFGCPGAGPITNAIYLRRLLADGVKPDAAVIEVHPLLLAAQTPMPPESSWFSPARLRPDEFPLIHGFGFPILRSGAHDCRRWLLPLHEYRLALVDRYARQITTLPVPMGLPQSCDAHGFFRNREVPPDERPKMLDRARRQYGLLLTDFRPGGCEVAALRDLLETCRSARIRTSLLLTPESSEFRSWYPEPGRAQILPLLAGLSREFGCPLVDGREWVPDELIADGHHLTGSGADAFTERLTREHLAPWLASPGTGGAP